MATVKKETAKRYVVTIKNNKEFCGIGAGGTQFAHGKAIVTNPILANWFKDREGYTVEVAKAE